jgi:hypothetical protein
MNQAFVSIVTRKKSAQRRAAIEHIVVKGDNHSVRKRFQRGNEFQRGDEQTVVDKRDLQTKTLHSQQESANAEVFELRQRRRVWMLG